MGVLDWISNVGGFLDSMTLLAGIIIGITVTNGPHIFLSSALTKSKENMKKISDAPEDSKYIKESLAMTKEDEIQKDCCIFTRFYVTKNCKWFCCLKMRLRDRFIIESHEEIEKEFHVEHIISQLRVCEGLARKNMTKEEWEEAQVKYGLMQISKETIAEANKDYSDAENSDDSATKARQMGIVTDEPEVQVPKLGSLAPGESDGGYNAAELVLPKIASAATIPSNIISQQEQSSVLLGPVGSPNRLMEEKKAKLENKTKE